VVEVGAGLTESFGLFNEADEDGGYTRVEYFHSQQADGEANEESHESKEVEESQLLLM